MDATEFLASTATTTRGPSATVPTVEAIYATGFELLSRERYADAAKVFRVMLHADPRDERGWLALGECHERIGQQHLALQLYGTGSILGVAAVRCHLARARVLRGLDRDDEANAAIATAEMHAAEREDESLLRLVMLEKGRTP